MLEHLSTVSQDHTNHTLNCVSYMVANAASNAMKQQRAKGERQQTAMITDVVKAIKQNLTASGVDAAVIESAVA